MQNKVDLMLLVTFIASALGNIWIWVYGKGSHNFTENALHTILLAGVVPLVAFIFSCPFKAQWRFRIHVPIVAVFWVILWMLNEGILTSISIHQELSGSSIFWRLWAGVWSLSFLLTVLFPLLIYVGLILWLGVNDLLFSNLKARLFSLGLILILWLGFGFFSGLLSPAV